MKKLPKPANLSQKKATKRICDGFGYDLGKIVFDKEEPRSKTKGKWETGEATQGR